MQIFLTYTIRYRSAILIFQSLLHHVNGLALSLSYTCSTLPVKRKKCNFVALYSCDNIQSCFYKNALW